MLRKKKLALSRETVRVLDGSKLRAVGGGGDGTDGANNTTQTRCSYRYSLCTFGDTHDCTYLCGDDGMPKI